MPIDLTPLVQIVKRLRAPDGCPWDQAQTSTTMSPALLEEVHEVLEAIDRQDPVNLQEELGDLLFDFGQLGFSLGVTYYVILHCT